MARIKGNIDIKTLSMQAYSLNYINISTGNIIFMYNGSLGPNEQKYLAIVNYVCINKNAKN